jgi:hypothetical protein
MHVFEMAAIGERQEKILMAVIKKNEIKVDFI